MFVVSSARNGETPPRAWGRPRPAASSRAHGGNTPTGVGKTISRPASRVNSRKHPHGRGEDRLRRLDAGGHGETPPRAWGRPAAPDRLDHHPGNTPTGVGKTCVRCTRPGWRGKHPHGRGEDHALDEAGAARIETPPRAWGRLGQGAVAQVAAGNTPTGVGKTTARPDHGASNRKHPHGRGEDVYSGRQGADG